MESAIGAYVGVEEAGEEEGAEVIGFLEEDEAWAARLFDELGLTPGYVVGHDIIDVGCDLGHGFTVVVHGSGVVDGNIVGVHTVVAAADTDECAALTVRGCLGVEFRVDTIEVSVVADVCVEAHGGGKEVFDGGGMFLEVAFGLEVAFDDEAGAVFLT